LAKHLEYSKEISAMGEFSFDIGFLGEKKKN
jgi:hypothetical protein